MTVSSFRALPGLLLVLYLAGSATAQEALIMALKSDSVDSPSDVKISLELANQAVKSLPSPPFRFESVSGVRRINRSDYDLLWDPFPSLDIPNDKGAVIKPGELSAGDTKVLVTSNPYSYIVHTDHRAVVEEIEVQYVNPEETDSGTGTAKFTKAGDEAKESDFARLRPGVHELKLRPEWSPKKYRIRFSVINDKPTTAANEWTEWSDWPGSMTSYFLAKLEGFNGRPEAIFEVLKGINAALRFEQFEVRKRISYIAADLEAEDEKKPGPIFKLTDNGFTLEIAVPADVKADKIWALFPITKEEQAAAVTTLKKWPPSPYDKMRVLLGSHSDATKLNSYPIELPPTQRDAPVNLATADPQWLVLSKTSSANGIDTFSQNFQITSKDAWADRLKAADQMVLLFERDPGQGDRFRGIITFQDEDNNSVFWQLWQVRMDAP